MSEFISIATQLNTDPRRIALLVQIVIDYFDGHDVGELKQRIADELSTITSTEMAYAVQTLADSRRAIGDETFGEDHELLVHSLLDGITIQAVEDGTPLGHPVSTFIRENRAIAALVAEIENRPDDTDREWWNGVLERLSQVDIHYTRKELQLFPFLEKAGFDRPSTVMWSVHDRIRDAIKRQLRTLDSAEPAEWLSTMDKTLEAVLDMITKEESILFPTSLQLLDDAAWTSIRNGEEEVGYCFIAPPPAWQPAGSPAEPAPASVTPATPTAPPPTQSGPRSRVGAIELQGGSLTPEEINLILGNLPVDVTFVDEHDQVRFYNRGVERVFPRSPGIIGREVRYCHPPKSVDVVLEIVSEFKNGNRDTAEFWIQMGGSFIHIRYFAVRDAAGTYKGVIEVSQDVTHLREPLPELEGDPA